jgi:hypothetical protein
MIENIEELTSRVQRTTPSIQALRKYIRSQPVITNTKLSSINKKPCIKDSEQPYDVFPPEIWLLILRECPTSSLKNLAQVNNTFHALASDQLLRTLVLGQGSIGHCVLDKTLENATVIKDPAAFSTLVLNHKLLRWYKAVKTVFVVYKRVMFVFRLSALPLVCCYITQRHAPEELDKYKWTVWMQRRAVVTLWPLDMWTVKHPVIRNPDTSLHPLVGGSLSRSR